MPTRLRDLPIRKKVQLVLLITSSVTLTIALGGLLLYQVVTIRQSFTADLTAIADIIASNSTAAVTFKDRKGGEEILAALHAAPYVVAAHITLPDDSDFARFGSPHSNGTAALPPGEDGIRFSGNLATYTRPVLLHGERIGALTLHADYGATFRRLLGAYAQVFGIVLALSIGLGLVLAWRMQRVVADPILRLAGAAARIAGDRDYSVRAVKVADDELGAFTDTFNQMLDEIEHRDTALRASEQRLDLVLTGADVGLWDWNLVTGSVLFSRRSAEILGYELPHDDSMTRSAETLAAVVHPDDLRPLRAAISAHFEGQAAMLECEHRVRSSAGTWVWVLTRGRVVERDPQGRPLRAAGTYMDISAQKQAQAELEMLHRKLLDTSRHAGMAEVATGVLHNVGNVLNSVNVSTTLLRDRIKGSKASSVGRVADLLRQHAGDLGPFLAEDPRGRMIPGYLATLGDTLAAEQADLLGEVDLLAKNVDHIKQIVTMQQSYAKVAGVSELVSLESLVEDALAMNAAAFARHDVRLVRDFERVPKVTVDRHRILQVLMNLLRNAKYALDNHVSEERLVTVRIRQTGPERVQVQVADNGIGISAENLTRIFSHGFTTKRDGHGFGLHSGALVAKEMGGSLAAASDGPGRGATFTLELPITAEVTTP